MKKKNHRADFKPTEGRALIGLVESDTKQYLIAIHYSLSHYCSLSIFVVWNMRVKSITLQLAETHDHALREREALIFHILTHALYIII